MVTGGNVTQCFRPGCNEDVYRESAYLHKGCLYCTDTCQQQHDAEVSQLDGHVSKGLAKRVSTNQYGRRAYKISGTLYGGTQCSLCGIEYGRQLAKHKDNWLVMQATNSNNELFFCCSGHHVSYGTIDGKATDETNAVKLPAPVVDIPIDYSNEVLRAAKDITNCYKCDRKFTNAAQCYHRLHTGLDILFFCELECRQEFSDLFFSYPCHKRPTDKWCDYQGEYTGGFMGHTCHNKIGSMTISTTPEEKQAAVERSRTSVYNENYCFGCGTELKEGVLVVDGYPTVQTSQLAKPHELLGTANFCTERCKNEWSHRQDFAIPTSELDFNEAATCIVCNRQVTSYIRNVSTGAIFCNETCKNNHTDNPVAGNHYRRGGIEAFDVIDAFELNFYEATAFTYILRSKFKGKQLEDIQKTIKTLQRYEQVLIKQKEK